MFVTLTCTRFERSLSPVLDVSKTTKGLAAVTANPSCCLVAGARNHLQANRSLAFQFEVTI